MKYKRMFSKILLLLLLVSIISFSGTSYDDNLILGMTNSTILQNEKGDVNGDGIVDVRDLIRVIHIILNIPPEPTEEEVDAGDINEDGDINVSDLIGIIKFIISGDFFCLGICGQAFLEGYHFHEGILIYNVEANNLTRTDSEGNFELPLPEDGTYTVLAAYAFFISDTVVVEVRDSTVVDSLQMNLVQYLKPRILPDTTVFSVNGNLGFDIEVTNLLNQEVCGPAEIRSDQLWLRDVQDTTKIFKLFVPTRSLPRAGPYAPFETKVFRFVEPASAYEAPPGTYQAWLADIFGPSPSPSSCPNTSLFGRSFGPAKGWVTIEIQ